MRKGTTVPTDDLFDEAYDAIFSPGEVYPLREVARRLPRLRQNWPVNVATVWRWATKGVRGVRLDTTLLGGVRVTTGTALRKFFGR
jgi:hypothetical protein